MDIYASSFVPDFNEQYPTFTARDNRQFYFVYISGPSDACKKHNFTQLAILPIQAQTLRFYTPVFTLPKIYLQKVQTACRILVRLNNRIKQAMDVYDYNKASKFLYRRNMFILRRQAFRDAKSFVTMLLVEHSRTSSSGERPAHSRTA